MNGIAHVSKEIARLSNLEILVISDTQTQSIPIEIGLLSKLEVLNVSYNEIQEIPLESI